MFGSFPAFHALAEAAVWGAGSGVWGRSVARQNPVSSISYKTRRMQHNTSTFETTRDALTFQSVNKAFLPTNRQPTMADPPHSTFLGEKVKYADGAESELVENGTVGDGTVRTLKAKSPQSLTLTNRFTIPKRSDASCGRSTGECSH